MLAVLSTAAMVVEPAAASAQSAPYAYDQNGAPPANYQGPPPPQPQGPPPTPYHASPPPAQSGYAPPPAQYGAPGYNGGGYQQNYRDYQAQYAQWSAQNCTTQHSNNIAAGAIIGGVAGALMAASIAGWAVRGAWVLFGGSLGLTAGALIGASTSAPGCPSGYAVRSGAPPFYYGGPAYPEGGYYSQPAYAPARYYGPGPSRDWMWMDGRWVRRPDPYGYLRPAPYPYRPY